MVKKVLSFTAGAIFLCLVGIAVYADSTGVFLQNDVAAMELVDRYISSVMKSYLPDGEDISFKGIIKQGCNFWYYNDYNNSVIAADHSAGTDTEVESADYSIEYSSVSYSNRIYTIKAKVTEIIKYKNSDSSVSSVSDHVILVEQTGSEMYIIDDTVSPESDNSQPETDDRIVP